MNPKQVRSLVDERWSAWKHGTWKAAIPAEPPQQAPRTAHVDWPSPTLPLLSVAYRGPAFSDADGDTAALDAIARLGFDANSPLYQKLVIEDQKVDGLRAGAPDNVDPELFRISARVKKAADIDSVGKEIIAAAQGFADQPVDAKKLEALKQHLRYGFALGMDNSEAIASAAAHYVALAGTPDSINRYYEGYAKLTPADLQRVAQKYLVDHNRTVVTLTGSGK